MIVIDSFLTSFPQLKEYSQTCEYRDEVNPSDGVTYPHICKEIPDKIREEVLAGIENALGEAPQNPLMFLRKSPQGVPVPHKFHTDNSMGRFSMMVYLQTHPGAGTGFAFHKDTGVHTSETDKHTLENTIKDCNDDSKWQIYSMAGMVENRAVIFDSSLFHVALPIGGFGQGKESRVVLTCFFS